MGLVSQTGSNARESGPEFILLTHLNTGKHCGAGGGGDVSTEQSFRGGYIKIPLEISHDSKVPETFVTRVSSVDRETEDFVISKRMDSIGRGHKVLGLQALASGINNSKDEG